MTDGRLDPDLGDHRSESWRDIGQVRGQSIVLPCIASRARSSLRERCLCSGVLSLNFRDEVVLVAKIVDSALAEALGGVHCAHARVAMNVQTLKKMAVCKALPPIPVTVRTQQGDAVRATWPCARIDG